MAIVNVDTNTGEIVEPNNLCDQIINDITPMIMSQGYIDPQYFGVMKSRIQNQMKLDLFRQCLQMLM